MDYREMLQVVDATIEEKLFLQILMCHIHGDCIRIEFDDINAKELERIAQSQQMQAIVHYELKKDSGVFLQTAFASQLSNYCNMKSAVRKFDECIKEYEHVFFKGASVSELYPIPQLRSMGDVDVLIHEYDRIAIHDRLLDLGFKFIEQSGKVWSYCKNGILFEVHDDLIHEESSNQKICEFFSDPWKFVNDSCRFDWSYHFLYLLVHLRHHLSGKGAGFRQFYDIAMLTEKCDLDWHWIQTQADKLSLLSFLKTVLKLNDVWFGITSKIQVDDLEQSLLERITRFVFNNGVFGFDNEASLQPEYSRIALKSSNSHRIIARTRYVFGTIFPSYKQMIKKEYCRYLQKSNLLLPVAWIHRIFLRMLRKGSKVTVGQKLKASNAVDSRIQLLRQMGL